MLASTFPSPSLSFHFERRAHQSVKCESSFVRAFIKISVWTEIASETVFHLVNPVEGYVTHLHTWVLQNEL